MNLRIISFVLLSCLVCARFLNAEESKFQPPKVLINGAPADVTVQEMAGFVSRPMRVLVNRNNHTRGDGFMRTYAAGARAGDEVAIELLPRLPGVRMTVYKIAHAKDGVRYLTMPESVYFSDLTPHVHKERVDMFDEETFILVSEKTDSPNEKNIQVRYFEERVRHLELMAYKTNLFFSALKFKLKDLSRTDADVFFERDAQLLVDRFTNPQEIILLRLWKKN